MRKWQFQEAKAKLSEVSRCAHSEGPQVITRFGKDDLVVLTKDEYDRLAPEKAGTQSDVLPQRLRMIAAELDLDEASTRPMALGETGPGWRAEPNALERLVQQITPENLHRETDWGSDEGREGG